MVGIFANFFVQEQAVEDEVVICPDGELNASEKPFENTEIRGKDIEFLKFLEQGQSGMFLVTLLFPKLFKRDFNHNNKQKN